MDVRYLTNKNLIDLELYAETKEEAIKKLSKMIESEGRLIDAEKYVDSVLDREKLDTTGIGMGVAIPHGKSNAVKRTTIAIGKLKKSIDWQSLDDKPVKYVFLLAIREDDSNNLHLKILASIASMLIDEDIVERLYKVESNEELLELLNKEVNEEIKEFNN